MPAFPFAGRARELELLAALLPRASGEGRRAALVAGEPGSGKSRLVRELAGRAAQDGALVLYGACDAVVQAPYGPFVEALGHLSRTVPADELAALLGSGAGELGRLLPELGRIVGPLPDPPAADPDTERHRLHTAVAELLTAVTRRRPLLLVLEDLHWAETSTLFLLRHLVRAATDARMLLVVTYRDIEADLRSDLSEALADLARSEGVVRQRLTGLSDDEVEEFVRLASGVAGGRELADAMHGLTDGNAFLLTELWRELLDTDALVAGSSTLQLRRSLAEIGTPETVRDVVGQRIARLGPETVEVLELGAIVGAGFELDVVRRAAELEEATLLDAVDEAVRSGLVFEAPGRGLAYRFGHELVRRSVIDRVSAPRRARLHLRVAGALERSPTDDERGRVAALAHHFAAAAPVGDVGAAAVSYNLLAAESAEAAFAFDEMADRLRTALALGIDDRRERAEVELRLGSASHRAGRSVDALGAFRAAAGLARELGDVELLARAAIGFEEACWRPAIHDEGAIELLAEAVAAVGPGPSELRVRLLGGLTRALDFRGELEAAADARDEAMSMARALGDRAGLGSVLASAFWSRGTRSFEEIEAMLDEAGRIGEELDDVELRAEALWWLVPTYVARCDHDAARAALERLFDLARALNEPFRLHVCEHYAAALALCDGDLGVAEAAALRSHEWSRLLRGRDASGVYGIQMFGIRREQGRLAELAPAVRVLAGQGRGAWAPGLAAVLAALGMRDDARRELARLRAEGLEPLTRSLWLGSLTYLTDAAAAIDDVETATLLYPLLEPHRGTNVQIGHLVACFGSADRYLGMLATVLGEWEAAEAHFEDALALNTRLGARTWVAHTAFEYARMLLARRAGDDRARAAALLGQAVGLATEIGLVSITTRVEALGERPVTTAGPDGLSARELEILRLVARGRSNREIGAELFISEHTAANHIRNILRKTGCGNRTEAAAYAHARGVVEA